MTVSFTTFDNYLFDSSYFDFEISQTVPSNVLTDASAIIDENGTTMTLVVQNNTSDDYGSVTISSNTEVSVTVIVQPITSKDRQILEMGYPVIGHKKAYFKPSYTSGGTTYYPSAGDMFIDYKGRVWRIENIIRDDKLGSTEAYKKAVLKNVDLGGSSGESVFVEETDVWKLDARTDAQQVIMENGVPMRLVRASFTTDDMGGVTVASNTDYWIQVLMQPISSQERQLSELGIPIVGHVKAYTFHKTTLGSNTYSPKENDLVEDREGRIWRIESIDRDDSFGNVDAYVKLILKNVDNDKP